MSMIISIQEEVDRLECQLKDAKQRLDEVNGIPTPARSSSQPAIPPLTIPHSLLLLSDSALPLGSFAYSSGLESFLAHTKTQSQQRNTTSSPSSTTSFHQFLSLSLSSIASTTLPYLLAAHRDPRQLQTLDNDLDASTTCTVARRASVAQGLALLGVWERSFRDSHTTTSTSTKAQAAAHAALNDFSTALKTFTTNTNDQLNGHLPPLWAVVCVAMDIDITSTAYVYMLNHAKAVLSAAVRASVMGPYQAQGVLASRWLQEVIEQRLRGQWNVRPEEAGQVVPLVDLWVGRHELLYSRIFNS
ncbi:urease accessory protein UreF [Paracoccidioides lutzii Pb01]|uniref:Urease accessory protein UreF n=1 Tax=Paracoccidioides lutzii (strain ATCC MYA-826 / Pb01) TaxID=502779 RepID=C1GXJ0_PARBA|nr:urease accessory protein UreF [Paracoccidioides lutzii Pb01]EEH41278.1 urease accessory protein UreF [Paracoccidioides lutzii Pb01]